MPAAGASVSSSGTENIMKAQPSFAARRRDGTRQMRLTCSHFDCTIQGNGKGQIMARNLTLRNVPDPVVKALRERARLNHRSMQKEVISFLQGTVLDRASLA